ncbi:MAG: UvrD-helicase domain-containing protein [Clostridia bacterium]|nr:UvrD-helicase domain-containing protein [Clostridia bacterium]
MAKIPFKPQQQAVIDCKNKNQLVSASAGSGKTTIMIQKIINMITIDKISIKNILVLTYTKASAEEMKQKLVSAIYEEVKTDPNLTSQIDEVLVADISTIHSFFQKLITKYFMVLGINPSFDIIDETKGIKFKSQALDKAISDYRKAFPEKSKNLFQTFGRTRNTEVVKELVKDLNTFLLAVPNQKQWLEKFALSLYDGVDGNAGIEILNQELYFGAKHFEKVFEKLQIESEACEEKAYVVLCNHILGQLSCIKASSEHFFENCEILVNFSSKSLSSKTENVHLYEKLATAKKSLSSFFGEVKGWPFVNKSTFLKQIEDIRPIAEALMDITVMYQEAYLEIKKQENVLDYDDLEKYMLMLIENKEICDEIRGQYEKIFVDEYQDANRVQEKIISSISKPNNRFMVGDVKQSIYGFRQAEPDIFLETMETFSNETKSEVGYLNYNFRSHSKILNFVNIVFSKIMTNQTSKIDYQSSSMFKWDDNYKDVVGQDFANVEINIIKKPEKSPKPQPTKIYSVLDETEGVEEFSDAELEAFFIAERISGILGKKIYVPKLGKEREIKYSDITILLRSRGSYLEKFCGVITALGIPLFANTSTSLFDDGDVELLLNLLKLTVNPKDDIALVSVMHSPFGQFTYEELSNIRLAGDSMQKFFECVENFKGDKTLEEKIQKFYETIQYFAFLVKNLGHFRAFGTFLEKYDFFEYVLEKEDGIEKKEKVQKFVNDFLSNGFNFDTPKFLEFVESNRKDIKAPNYTGGENCVSITTMHSSKGLEYPVVIIANANQDFDKMPENHNLKLNQKLGIGIKHYDKELREASSSLPYVAIKKANKNSDFAEKLRLLYVALTRPQNHLIVVGTISKSDFISFTSDFQITRQKSYLKLLLGALSEEEIEKINDGEDVVTEEYCVKIVSGKTESGFMRVSQEKPFPAKKELTTLMKQYLEYVPEKESSILHTSVTALKNALTVDAEKGGNAENLETGILYHNFLEKIDFNQINSLSDVQSFISKNQRFVGIDETLVFDAITKIKALGQSTYIKEIPFSMKVNLDDKNQQTIVKGIIDLLCVGKENILVDYKYTDDKNTQNIINKYKPQLDLYQKACELTGQIKINKKYLLLLKTSELVEIK